MIDIEIDGRPLQVEQNTTIIEAADQVGIYIPRFCYHKKLSIAANCRMCLVEVEKSGKPLPACATPVTAGMKVFTESSKAKEAQRSVMEFLLINHPLDCPICDQGGECELQDLSLGYGQAVSRFTEGKRSVKDDNLGSLISTEMTRCIQCTRCVRFGQEIAGLKELGTLNRGENLQIGTYIEHSVESELSGNIIDLCPVGALTSKPFRFSARAWELQQSPSIAPHDCLGSNIYLHTRREEVMRAVPRENENINETWASDRDRYSYLGIHTADRLTKPYIKEDGQWFILDWETALEKVIHGFQAVLEKDGAAALGALASPSSTTEELYLLQKLWRGFGSQNIDHRLHQTDSRHQDQIALFPPGINLAELEQQEFILLVGSNIRREQPLASNRLRKAQLAGTKIASINCLDIEFPFQLNEKIIIPPQELPFVLAGIAKALNSDAVPAPWADIPITSAQKKLAEKLKSKRSVIILGAIAQNHPQAATITQLCEWIAEHSDTVRCVVMTEGANSAGAWLAGAVPHRLPGGVAVAKPGLSAHEMFNSALKAYLLLNIEPSLDCANPNQAVKALRQADWVVALSPYKSNYLLEHAHIILPMTSFAEMSGSFVNVAGEWQDFAPAIPPLGQAKPAWEILQTLGNLAGLADFNQATHDFIRAELRPALKEQFSSKGYSQQLDFWQGAAKMKQPECINIHEDCELSGNAAKNSSAKSITRITEWPLYRVDSLVRRSPALQAAAGNDRVGVAMNTQLAKVLQLKEGQMVQVKQGTGQASLAVLIDERLPNDCVWIPAGCDETASLGESFVAVEIYAE
ncbi:NADH dehydrogenase I chain G [Candidatus Rickettsiella viridis]|uniref:NADH-quinone oxidoreductase n=1 Tax=Candidatus Rickettsiella viridis TaxID=676208 RepID=A0A2Z5UWA7_9COXI|nr:NADH-quinone oxidoreductase subunit NuoG [Candidatus Rickettsiella viridis]BBB15321.1 NADH dehydrogenase I chain G [Candidatus Rickettsiella viridis]